MSEYTYSYTPGLKIQRVAVIRKTRTLPLPGEVLVNNGEKVSFNTIIARTLLPGAVHNINVALQLGVDPKNVSNYITKKVGDIVEEDEVIAKYTLFGGLLKRYVKSPFRGTLENISEVTGQVSIRGMPIPVEVNSYIPGEVVEVIPKFGATIETKGAFIQGIFGIGGENHGEIELLVKSPDETITESLVKQRHKGKVVVGGSLITGEALKKAKDIGVSGIITGGIMERDLIDYLGFEIGVAITGDEEGPTLIITEGFGNMNMHKTTFNILKLFEGYECAVSGTTQIRAGVIRPEIIIPHNLPLESVDYDKELSKGIHVGTPVRIIRNPYFGKIGKVIELPIELERIETESHVRVVRVKLEDGETVTVPRANIEIIEA